MPSFDRPDTPSQLVNWKPSS